MMPKIKSKFPATTLHVFSNVQNYPQLKTQMEKSDYIFLHGRVSQAEIAYELSISDIWLYPTDFKETYCIAALEAQAAGCLCITMNLGSLKEVISNRGILIDGEIDNEETQNEIISQLNILENQQEKNELTAKAREWGLRQDFKHVVKDWTDNLFTL